MKDLHSNIKLVQSLTAATYTSDQNGATIDRQGFEAVEHIVEVGVSGDTLSGSVKIDFVLQESDDDSTWTDVTDAAAVVVGGDGVSAAPDANGIFATVDDAAEDDKILRIGYVGGKRYSRVEYDFTGTHSNGIPLAGCAVLHCAEQADTSDV